MSAAAPKPMHFPAWRWADLKRPLPLLAAITGLAVSAPVSVTVSCNVHEIGHVLVGVPLGWKVERINWCLLSEGSVDYSHIGTSPGNLEGYAGGIIAAAFLVTVYFLLFAAHQRPLLGPGWWAAGLGVVLWVGPQIVFGITEGAVRPERSYVDFIDNNPAVYATLIVGSAVAGAVAHAWLWRVLFTPRPG